MNQWRAYALALLVALLAGVGRAGADAPDTDGSEVDSGAPHKAPVVLDGRACPAIPEGELRRLLALELTPRKLAAPGESAETDVVHARITCNGSRARLSVEDIVQDKRQELELDLQETMVTARTRLLALTLSELIATLDMELAQSTHAEASAASTQPDATPSSANTWRGYGWLGVGLAREGRPALLAPALQLGGLWYLPSLPLALSFDLLGSHGRRTLSEGSLSTWTLAGSATLAARVRMARLELLFGAGLRLGYARLEGAPQSDTLRGAALSSWWWGPLLSAGLLVRLRGRWGLRAALELAYVAKPVRGLDANEQAAYALEHLQLHALLAITVGFR